MVPGLRMTAVFAAALTTCAAVGVVLAPAAPIVYAGTAQTYVVLYGAEALPGDAAAHVQASGGSIVAAYPEIGVVIARSAATSFTQLVENDSRVAGVTATGAFGSGLKEREPAADQVSAAVRPPSLADQ